MKKVKEKELKKSYMESLGKQVKEKELSCMKESEIDCNLNKMQLEYIRNLEDQAKKRKDDKIKRVHEEKEKMLNIHRGKTNLI